jgi:hypothetical protein
MLETPEKKPPFKSNYGTCKYCKSKVKFMQDRFSGKIIATKPGTDRAHSCNGRSNSPFYSDRVKLNDF